METQLSEPARELHDQAVQAIAAAVMFLELDLPYVAPARQDEMRGIIGSLCSACDELRRTVAT